jgi:hypothetical protein
MPQARKAPIRSTEDIRTFYRTLGVREQTLARAIQYSESRSEAPDSSTNAKQLVQTKRVGRLSRAPGKVRRRSGSREGRSTLPFRPTSDDEVEAICCAPECTPNLSPPAANGTFIVIGCVGELSALQSVTMLFVPK